MKYRGEGSQILWICFLGLSGSVPSEGSSDVQLVVCLGACTDSFWGQQLQYNDATVLFPVCSCFASSTRPCDVIDEKMKFTAQ